MASRELLPLPRDVEEKRPLVGASQERSNERQVTSRSVALVAASIVGALLVLSGMVRGSQSIGYSNKHRTYTDPKFDQVKRDNDRLRQQIEELTRNKDAKDRAELEQVSRNEALRRDLANPFTPSPPSGAAVPPAPVLPSGAPDYRLSVERIKAHCDSHNIILVTFVNSKRANYAYTWASHLMRLRLTNYMVGAMDGEALVKLAKRNITAFDMAAGLTTADYGWGTKNFRMLGLRKSELIITLLKAGADPIVTDADALITRDPTPYILRYGKGADILVTSDQLSGVKDEGLEMPSSGMHAAWNIGYFYLKHTSLAAMLHWQQKCADNPKLWDQNLFKDVLKIGGLQMPPRNSPEAATRLFRGYNRTLAIGILPVRSFCSGHTYFVQRMPQRAQIEPYSVHTTFQYSGAVGKLHRLREAHLWEDPPGYFAPQKGLLAFAPRVRRELIRPSGTMDVASHFQLVHEQLVQVRAAFLLAERLGRLLVLPKLVCGLDRFWAPHNGTISGSDTTLPIDPCPADHVLDLERMAGMLPKESGGLEGVLREYSFLEHPKLPAAVRTDVKQLAPPASLGDASLRPLLELQATRVLNLTHMPDLYATLPAAEAEAAQRRMREWTSIWCCSLPLSPKAAGHVWYDFFWDVVPHTDRHKKLWPAPWAVTFGP